MYKYLFPLILYLFALYGCGQDIQAGTSGVFIDPKTETYLEEQFIKIKACLGFEHGSFDELSITFTPPSFPCTYSEGSCNGEFHTPNYIFIGSFAIYQHEITHYLLYVNTGDLDPDHQTHYFILSCL